MAADVTKSVRISFNLNANFKKALENINTAFNTIKQSAATVNTNLTPIANSINKIKPPADFDKFVSGLRSLASIKAENITKIQTALNNVAKVKFPDFSTMNPKIEAHANAVNKLGDAYIKLGQGMKTVDMRRLSNAVASGNAAINNQGQIISRNRTAFAQYAYAIGSASSGLSVLGSRLYGITRGFSAISRELSASLGIFVSVFGAMFAIKGVVKDLVAFDDAMRRTAAVANASASELQLMTDAARQMGETTRYTAQQAAEGLQLLALSGLNASEATQALPTVLNAAASEGLELKKAADVLLATMNAYGMEVKDLVGVSDILVATSVNSATSLLQLKESMKQVAPIAASAGIDLAQLSALLGTLADTGIRGCYDKNTDVLTKTGWKNWNDVNYNDEFATYNKDNNSIEYQKADKLIKYIHNGKMYKIKNKGIDLCVTPDHRMYVSQGRKDNFEILFAKDIIGKHYKYKTGGMNWQGNDDKNIILPSFCQNRGSYIKNIPALEIDAKLWASFLGWYISEGHCNCDKGGNYRVVITQKKIKHLSEIEELLTQLPFNWYRCESTGQYTITNEQLYRFLQPLGNCYNKHIPQYAKDWNKELLNNLLTTLMKGDGDKQGVYYTSSIRLKDDFQEIALKLGYRTYSTIHTKAGTEKGIFKGQIRRNTVDAWCIRLSQKTLEPSYNPYEYRGTHGLRRIDNKTNTFEGYINYNDYVYCAEVPNGLLIVRRNGKAIISGNSKAGTVLKNAITRLLSPTKMVREALSNYNLTADELIRNNTDATTGQLDFIAVLEQMRSKSIETGDAMRIFGLIAGSGMVKLLSSSNESIVKLYETLQNAEGTSLKVAYEMESGVGGALRRLKSMWEELSISIGDAINDDLVDFFENLTRVINENKQSITTFVSLLMRVIGVFISFSVAVGELYLKFPELSITLTVVTGAILSFLAALKTAQIIGFTGAVAGLMGLNFLSFATTIGNSIQKIATFNLMLQAVSFTNFSKGLKWAFINLGVFISQLKMSLVLLSPYIVVIIGVTAAIYGLVKAYQALFPNYEKMRQKSELASKSAAEFNRVLEYQKTELNLISKSFDVANKYGSDTASLEQRLTTLITNANIPYEKRLKLLQEYKKGQKDVNQVITELNDLLIQSTQINRELQMEAEIQALSAQEQLVKKLNKDYENLLAKKTAMDAWVESVKRFGNIKPTGELTKQALDAAKAAEEATNKFDQMAKKFAENLIPAYVESGKSAQEFEEKIRSMGDISEQTVNKMVSLFKTMAFNLEHNIGLYNKQKLATEEGAKQQLNSMRQLNSEYEEQAKKIDDVEKAELSSLKLRQQEAGISEEQALKEQVELNNIYTIKKMKIAEDYFKKIKEKYDALAPEYKTAESEQTKEVEAASKAKADAYQAYIDSVTEGLSELRKKQTEYNKEIKKSNDDIEKAKLDSIDKIIDAEKDLNDKLLDASQKLKNDKLRIEEDLAKDLQKISEKRVDIENDKQSNVLSIEENLQDKLRSIRQESMTDAAKDVDNYAAAEAKLAKGRQQAEEAARTNNEELLRSGQRLVEQASSLYEGLKNRSKAMSGVTASAQVLTDIEEKSSQIKLQNLEKEKQKAIEQAEAEKQAKQKAYDEDVISFKKAYNDKIKTAIEGADKVIKAQEAEITNHRLKLDLLEQEIQKTLLLKRLELTDTSSNINTDANLKKLEQYEKAIIELNKRIKSSELSPNVDTNKLKAFDDIYKKVMTGADLSNSSVNNLTNSTEKLINKSAEFDKFEYKIKFSDGSMQTLEGDLATIKSELNKIKSQAVIQVKLPNGNIETIKSNINTIDETLKDIPSEYIVNIKTFSNLQEVNEIKKQTESTLSNIKLKPDTELFYSDIKNLTSVIESTIGNISIDSTKKELDGLDKLIQGVEKKITTANESEIDIKANPQPIQNLKETLDSVTDKLVKILAEVQGKQELIDLAQQIANLQDKTITITQKIEKVEENQAGGLVGHYANGGNVFRRLSSPFISKGSGSKDDVPAMLMKGEFVQKVSAVKKYGRDFMAKLNAGVIPKYITQMFADGGFVSHLGLNLRNNNGISDMLGLMKSSLYTPVPAYAMGGYVNNKSDSYSARIELALGNKTYTVKAQTNVAKELVKEMKRYGRVI